MVRKFAYDAKVGGVVVNEEGCVRLYNKYKSDGIWAEWGQSGGRLNLILTNV